MTALLDDPKLLWYVSRATGLVCLVLLTLSVVLGITATIRVSSAGWPRFVTQGLHRNVSLFVVVLLGLHIAAVVIDDYVRIHLTDAVIPFRSDYRPLWLGLGTVAFDVLLTLVLTSLLRQRLGYGTWRAVHWLAYACWPLAVVHGLGTGTDPRQAWAGWLIGGCVALVLLAVAWRIVEGWPSRAVLRLGAVALTACGLAVLVTWARQGPLQAGWSQRAGTPPPASSADR